MIIAARNSCMQVGMLPVPHTLAVIAALIHAASYLLNSKLLFKFIPIIRTIHLIARDMYAIVKVGQHINTLYLNNFRVFSNLIAVVFLKYSN